MRLHGEDINSYWQREKDLAQYHFKTGSLWEKRLVVELAYI